MIEGTHVKIPPGLFSIATTAELTFNSSIFFDAVNTVSVGATVTTLSNQDQEISCSELALIYYLNAQEGT